MHHENAVVFVAAALGLGVVLVVTTALVVIGLPDQELLVVGRTAAQVRARIEICGNEQHVGAPSAFFFYFFYYYYLHWFSPPPQGPLFDTV